MPWSAWTTRSPGDEVGRLGDELVEVAPPPRSPRQTVAEDVLLAEKDERVGREALFERQYREPDRRPRQCRERAAVGDAAQIGNSALAQHAEEALGRAFAKGGDCGLMAGFALGFEVVAYRLEQRHFRVGALSGEIAHRAGAGVELVTIGFGRGEG